MLGLLGKAACISFSLFLCTSNLKTWLGSPCFPKSRARQHSAQAQPHSSPAWWRSCLCCWRPERGPRGYGATQNIWEPGACCKDGPLIASASQVVAISSYSSDLSQSWSTPATCWSRIRRARAHPERPEMWSNCPSRPQLPLVCEACMQTCSWAALLIQFCLKSYKCYFHLPPEFSISFLLLVSGTRDAPNNWLAYSRIESCRVACSDFASLQTCFDVPGFPCMPPSKRLWR